MHGDWLDWFASIAPHNRRRAIYARRHPGELAYLDRVRTGDVEGYSFAPFDEHRCIFVHVPKTGGVSVAEGLFGSLGGGHTTLTEYQVALEPEAFRRYFKFAFVRNPWDRLCSAFHFLRDGGMADRDRAWVDVLARYDGVDDFVRDWVSEEHVGRHMHFVPQARFVCLPRRRTPSVDFLGRFERLHEDYAAVQERLGLPGTPLPHRNPSIRQLDYRDEYSDTARAVVARVYRDDIERFGYAFD